MRSVLVWLATLFIPCMSYAGDSTTVGSNKGPPTDPDALLKAINFALTGSDGGGFIFSDRQKCTVLHLYDKAAVFYYLNSVQYDRLQIRWYQVKYSYEATAQDWVEVELHGDQPVFEENESKEIDHTVKFRSAEHDRVGRAWRFIYSHGCKTARSAF